MAGAGASVNVENTTPDELIFHDIPHSEDSYDSPSDKSKSQTHTFTNFPHNDASDDDEDKTELLRGEKKPPSFWTFEYYQSFFDVDTHQVLWRIAGSMLPNPKSNYLQRHIRPNPDLYGPFWVCTTLVFTTAIAGNLAKYIHFAGEGYDWVYDFKKVSLAATAVFGYWWALPSMLYILLWWRNSQAGISFIELLCVYGYSLSIYIPVSILWVIPSDVVRWILVVIAVLMSGSVLVITFWPSVSEDNKKVSVVTMVLMVLFHALLAAGFVLYFFQVSKSSENPGFTTTKPILNTTILHSTSQAPLQIASKMSAPINNPPQADNLLHPNSLPGTQTTIATDTKDLEKITNDAAVKETTSASQGKSPMKRKSKVGSTVKKNVQVKRPV